MKEKDGRGGGDGGRVLVYPTVDSRSGDVVDNKCRRSGVHCDHLDIVICPVVGPKAMEP